LHYKAFERADDVASALQPNVLLSHPRNRDGLTLRALSDVSMVGAAQAAA
jgi:hypothetical protein